jgi:hypothetical protein
MIESLRAVNLWTALNLAQSGFRIFPARAVRTTAKWDKPPCISAWRSLATTDPDQIAFWWKQFPEGIPAIPCDTVVVIDSDRRSGGPDGVAALAGLVASHGDWPHHPISSTPGSGMHDFFGQPEQRLGNRRGVLPDGIDVRGNGGYIIGPGAVLPDGSRYRSVGNMDLAQAFATGSIPLLPIWLEKLLRADPITPTGTNSLSISSVTSRERTYAETVLEAAVSEVQSAPKGRRNTTLNNVAYRLGRMVGAGWIDRNSVAARLFSAASALKRDDGATAVKDTIDSGLTAGRRQPHPGLSDRKW